ncbi:MAG: LLM class flavin-dependent oxidoreductase [Xanthobacteraceae bacterium]
MKFVCFHLMPYRPLDLEAAKKYRSAWVVLPNSFYDPEKGAAEYDSYLDQLTYAEELGFDAIGVNEHHQTAYGLMPAPNLIASALIQRTKKVQIAVLGRALPLVSNPINIAEEFAMLDVLSKGRLIAGFVRGIGAEYHSTGVNPAFSHERFHEAHDLIVKAWTTPGPFEFEGDHFRLRYVNLWPRPYQKPHPPVWIPSMGSRETVVWASAPERKYPFMVTFSPESAVVRYHNMYREAAQAHGYTASGGQLGWATPIYVAESDQQARDEAKAGIESLFNKQLSVHAVGNAAAARLHVQHVAESDTEAAAGARRAAAPANHRRTDRQRHDRGRQSGNGARKDRAGSRTNRLRNSHYAIAVRRAARPSGAPQYGNVCRRGNAEAALSRL